MTNKIKAAKRTIKQFKSRFLSRLSANFLNLNFKLQLKHNINAETSAACLSVDVNQDRSTNQVSNGPLQLFDLSEELLLRILGYLSFKSLLICRTISRGFNSLITQSTHLQYAIALGTHRYVHNATSSFSFADCLRRLQAHEEAWRTLQHRFIQQLDVPHHTTWVHDLNGDIFLLGDSVSRQEVIDSNGSSALGTDAVSCLALQSSRYFTNSGVADKWKSFDVGRDIINAAMAIREHDLIALATMYAIPSRPSTSYSHCPSLQQNRA
jgi:F-box domain